MKLSETWWDWSLIEGLSLIWWAAGLLRWGPRDFSSASYASVMSIPVPRGQRPGRRFRVCGRPSEWTLSAWCRSPTHRCKAPSPPGRWLPTHAPDVGLNCTQTQRGGEKKPTNSWLASLQVCIGGSRGDGLCGWGLSEGGFLHPSGNHWDEMNTLSLWWPSVKKCVCVRVGWWWGAAWWSDMVQLTLFCSSVHKHTQAGQCVPTSCSWNIYIYKTIMG